MDKPGKGGIAALNIKVAEKASCREVKRKRGVKKEGVKHSSAPQEQCAVKKGTKVAEKKTQE